MKLLKINIILLFLLIQQLFSIGNQPAVNVYGLSGILDNSSFFSIEKAFVSPGMGLICGKQGISLGMYQLYQIPDFNYRYVEIVPFRRNRYVLGAHLGQLGNDLYNETQLMMSVAFRLKNRLVIGGLVHLYDQQIKNYGRHLLYGLSVDAVYQFSERLIIQSQWKHAMMGGDLENQDLNQALTMNLVVTIHSKFNMSAGMYAGLEKQSGMMLGLQYIPLRMLALSIAEDPVHHTVRIGSQLKWHTFSVSYGFFYHPDLDATHSFGVGWTW